MNIKIEAFSLTLCNFPPKLDYTITCYLLIADVSWGHGGDYMWFCVMGAFCLVLLKPVLGIPCFWVLRIEIFFCDPGFTQSVVLGYL